MGTHLRVLSESFPMNTNMTGFRWFLKIFASLCFVRKYPQHWKGFNSAKYFVENYSKQQFFYSNLSIISVSVKVFRDLWQLRAAKGTFLGA